MEQGHRLHSNLHSEFTETQSLRSQASMKIKTKQSRRRMWWYSVCFMVHAAQFHQIKHSHTTPLHLTLRPMCTKNEVTKSFQAEIYNHWFISDYGLLAYKFDLEVQFCFKIQFSGESGCEFASHSHCER